MQADEKIKHRFKLAAALKKILDRNKEQVQRYALNDKESFWIVDSLRQLEATSGLSYTIVQGVFAAKRDLQFTSLVTLICDGFDLSFVEFAKIFDAITDDDIRTVKKLIAAGMRRPAAKAVKKKRK